MKYHKYHIQCLTIVIWGVSQLVVGETTVRALLVSYCVLVWVLSRYRIPHMGLLQ